MIYTLKFGYLNNYKNRLVLFILILWADQYYQENQLKKKKVQVVVVVVVMGVWCSGLHSYM